MKKLAYFLLAVPLIAFQCSNNEDEYDCGCNSKAVVKELVEATGTIQKKNPDLPDRTFYIFLENVETEGDFFKTVIACDSMTFNDEKFKDGSRIMISGAIKSLCLTEARVGSSPIKVKEVKLVSK